VASLAGLHPLLSARWADRRVGALGLATPSPDQRGPHMLGIELPREAARAIARQLIDSSVVASVRGRSLRIAPHLHTTQDDVDRLLNVLTTVVQHGT